VRPLVGGLGALAALLLAPAAAFAEVEFVAVVDKDEVGLDDTLTLTVSVSLDSGAKEEKLELPAAPAFQVLSRSQSQSTSFSMGGGPPSFKHARIHTLVLAPTKAGTFTIRPGTLRVGGKTYRTGAIQVTVDASRRPAQRPRPSPANPFGFPDDLFGNPRDMFADPFGNDAPPSDSDLYVRNHVDKRKVFLGEQITLSTYLFSQVDVSGIDNPKTPKLDDFWVEDLENPSQISGELKNIDGVTYRVFLLRKRALFPVKAGKLTIDPFELDISTGFRAIFAGRKVHRASQPVTIEVQPLPPGAPTGFESPNVGQWRLSAEASPTNVKLGQPVTLKLLLEGTGNLKSVVVPKLPPIPGLKAYEPTRSDRVSTSKGRFGGQRVLEYLLMPEKTGELQIPSLSFATFDPVSGSYRSDQTQPITVMVEATSGVTTALTGAQLPVGGDRPVNLLGGGLRSLRFTPQLERPSPPLFLRSFYLPVAASPLVLWLGLVLVGAARSAFANQAPGARQRRAGSRTRKRLRKAESLLAESKSEAFYSEVSRALNDYLTDKLGVSALGLTRDELNGRLARVGVSDETSARLDGVLDSCDAGRFAPGAGEQSALQRVLTEALAVMEAIESTRLASSQEVSS